MYLQFGIDVFSILLSWSSYSTIKMINQNTNQSVTSSEEVQSSNHQDCTSGGSSAINSVRLDDSDSDADSSSESRHFTTVTKVSPHLSNMTKRQQITNKDEFM